MDRKTLNIIIPILAVVIFFVWGWIEGTNEHSWIIFMISGGAMAVLASMDKNKKKEAEKAKEKENPENR